MNVEQPSTLEVSGTGRVSVPADRAHLSFGVETEGSTAAEAAGANADVMDRAIAALRREAGSSVTITTHGYGLHPQYAQNNTPRDREGPRITGYRAVNTLSVVSTDVSTVGQLIDAATAAGINRIQSLTFDAQDTEAARREALSQAVAHARAEAEVIAEALGVTLGPPLRVQGGRVEAPMPQMYMRAAAMEASPTPIEAGDQEVAANVTITYRLGGD